MSEHLHGLDLDAAVSRFEDVLLALPFDRALPDVATLLDLAGLPTEVVRRDERVLKVLHEAVLARPFGDHDRVVGTRTEVELLTLEVQILGDRLASPSTSDAVVDAAVERLAAVRRRLQELRAQL